MPNEPADSPKTPAPPVDYIVQQVGLALRHLEKLGPEADPARSAVADILGFAFGGFTRLAAPPPGWDHCPRCMSRRVEFTHEPMLMPVLKCLNCGSQRRTLK